MLAIELPPDIENRLSALAQKTGHSPAQYVQEAIRVYLEDLEDFYLAEERSKTSGQNISLQELMRRYDLED